MNSICSSIICLIFVFLSKHAAANALTKEELKALEDDLASMESFWQGFQAEMVLNRPDELEPPPRTIYQDFFTTVYHGWKKMPLFEVNWKSWGKWRTNVQSKPKKDDRKAILNYKNWAKFHHALDLRLFSIYVLKEDKKNKEDNIHAHFHLRPVIIKKPEATHHGSAAAEKSKATHHGSAAEKPDASHHGSEEEKPEASHHGLAAAEKPVVVHSNEEIPLRDLVEAMTYAWLQFKHGQHVDVFNDKYVWKNEKECLAAKNVKDGEFEKVYKQEEGGLWNKVKEVANPVVGNIPPIPLIHY